AQTDGGHSRASCQGIATVAGTALATELVADGFKRPVHLAAPPDDVGRLFVVEQDGTIKLIKSGKTLTRPFLDIRDRVRSGGERGLLSIAFHPDFGSNRRFFVYYTEATGDLVIAEFASAATDPDVADPGSERRLLVIPHRKYGNHNGGQLAFGPDRYLYIGTGDGGSAGDPDNNSQNRTSLLGKLLRIDVDHPKGGKSYGIPSSNPFVKDGNAAPEVWEEVDVQPASSAGGENYGWRYMEGAHCYDPREGCPTRGLTWPVFEYRQQGKGYAITGGFVYRGCRMPDLRGTYFFSDYVKGFSGTFVLTGGRAAQVRDITHELAPPPPHRIEHLSSFGEDAQGELYLIEHEEGAIFRLVPSK
ncbi:MAG: PQQ-dependent sugar dehydrogenase, partial [Nitrospirae bacterium]